MTQAAPEPPDPAQNWMNVHTVADFLAYIHAFDRFNHCAHGKLWTRCWSCGHFEDCLDDHDEFEDFDTRNDAD